MQRFFAFTLITTALACVTASAPNQASVFGQLRLVPHADVRDAKAAGNAYGDRRMRGVELVDYSRPGFSVVYVDVDVDVEVDVKDSDSRESAEMQASSARVDSELRLSIKGGDIRARFEPARAAIRIGGAIRLRNLDRELHVVSCPGASLLHRLGPGEEVRIELTTPGVYRLYLADLPGIDSIVYATPGPFAVVSSSGRFQIPDVSPGRWTLRAWHPRFPPVSQQIVLAAGESLEVDFEIGVGRDKEPGR